MKNEKLNKLDDLYYIKNRLEDLHHKIQIYHDDGFINGEGLELKELEIYFNLTNEYRSLNSKFFSLVKEISKM